MRHRRVLHNGPNVVDDGTTFRRQMTAEMRMASQLSQRWASHVSDTFSAPATTCQVPAQSSFASHDLAPHCASALILSISSVFSPRRWALDESKWIEDLEVSRSYHRSSVLYVHVILGKSLETETHQHVLAQLDAFCKNAHIVSIRLHE